MKCIPTCALVRAGFRSVQTVHPNTALTNLGISQLEKQFFPQTGLAKWQKMKEKKK